MSTVVARRAVICGAEGLHLRVAAEFARLASGFEAEVRLLLGDHAADGKSILDLLGLAAGPGREVVVEARGPDAEPALAALVATLDGARLDVVPVRPLPGVPAPIDGPARLSTG